LALGTTRVSKRRRKMLSNNGKKKPCGAKQMARGGNTYGEKKNIKQHKKLLKKRTHRV